MPIELRITGDHMHDVVGQVLYLAEQMAGGASPVQEGPFERGGIAPAAAQTDAAQLGVARSGYAEEDALPETNSPAGGTQEPETPSTDEKPSQYRGKNAEQVAEKLIAAAGERPLLAEENDDIERLPKKLQAKVLEALAAEGEPHDTNANAEDEADPFASDDEPTADEWPIYGADGDIIETVAHGDERQFKRRYKALILAETTQDELRAFMKANAALVKEGELSALYEELNAAGKAHYFALAAGETAASTSGPAEGEDADDTEMFNAMARAFQDLSRAGGREATEALLREFKVKKVVDIPPEQYEAITEACKARLAHLTAE